MDAQSRAYREDEREARQEREAMRQARFAEPSEAGDDEDEREAEGWIGQGLATDDEEA